MRAILAAALATVLLAASAVWAEGPLSDVAGVVEPLVGRPVTVSAAALLVSGMTGGRLAAAPWAAVVPSDGEGVRVVTAVDLGLHVLQELPAPWSLEVVTYALTADEAVVATSALALELAELPGGGIDPTGGVRGIQIVDTLVLEPGDYVLRTLVRERGSGELALVVTDVEVPRRRLGTSPEALWMLRPAAAWLLVIPPADGLDPRVVPVGVATELIPAAIVELRAGDIARAQVLLPARPAGGGVSVVIRDELGHVVASAPASLDPPPAAGPLPDTQIAAFTVPALEPGAHTLSFRVEGGETDSLAFLVPAVAELEAEGSAPGLREAETASLRGPTRSVRAAIDLYQEALALCAAGNATAAAVTLRRLEEGVGLSRRSNGLQWLMKAQQNVIDRLAAQAPSGLTQALALHAGLLSEYSADGEPALESHAMQVLLRLASAIDRRAKPGDRPRGAEALAHAGASLQSAGWALQADRLFELALDLDGGNRAALLGAAALREKTEAYAEAAALLESLVEAHPDDEEATLRLAINLTRVKRVPRAIELLRALAPRAESEWISVVAFQELARLESASDLDAAVRTLESGLERFPGEQGLALFLTLLRDRRSPGDWARVPAELLRGAPEGPAPRYLYNRWPRTEAGSGLDEIGRRELTRWLEGRTR